MSKEKHFKIYDGEEPIKLIEFLNNGTINFANDEVKMTFEAGVKYAQNKINNGVLDDLIKCRCIHEFNERFPSELINKKCNDCGGVL